MLSLLLAVHTMFGPVTPAPLHYKLVNKSTVELSMGGMPPIALTMSGFVSITSMDSAGGRVVMVTIDSSSFDAGEMAAMAAGQMGEDPKGVTLHAFMLNGKTQSITPSSDNKQAMLLAPAVQLLLSGTRVAKAGESWVDSTVADTAVSTMMSKTSVVTTWKATEGAGGAMQYDGTVVGTTTVGAGAMQMNMQTSGTSHLTARKGELPSAATSSTTGTGNMDMGGQSMTMKVTTDISATPVP